MNILKASGIMIRVSEEQKNEMIGWVRKFAEQAEEAKINSRNIEFINKVKAHRSNFHGGLPNETPEEVLGRIYRTKASVFAHAIAIMNSPEKISELGEWIYEMDPNKIYSLSERQLTRILKGKYPQAWFPSLR